MFNSYLTPKICNINLNYNTSHDIFQYTPNTAMSDKYSTLQSQKTRYTATFNTQLMLQCPSNTAHFQANVLYCNVRQAPQTSMSKQHLKMQCQTDTSYFNTQQTMHTLRCLNKALQTPKTLLSTKQPLQCPTRT